MGLPLRQLVIDPIDLAPKALENPDFPFIELGPAQNVPICAEYMVGVLGVEVVDSHHRTPHVLEHGLELFRRGEFLAWFLGGRGRLGGFVDFVKT